jgi:hypothetical protein
MPQQLGLPVRFHECNIHQSAIWKAVRLLLLLILFFRPVFSASARVLLGMPRGDAPSVFFSLPALLRPLWSSRISPLSLAQCLPERACSPSYASTFAQLTPLDLARGHKLLLDHLGIRELHAIVGSSLGRRLLPLVVSGVPRVGCTRAHVLSCLNFRPPFHSISPH